ncbi:gliding motility-associated C-terminal domain-containing protein, partial [bacterium AH-315-C20]|nr:gliding motility-associated C-terminal domain-containing protein [bacterium AH-315-C20]
VSGEIPSWVEETGGNWISRDYDPVAFDGQYYFFAGAGSFAELSQTIDVSSWDLNITKGTMSFDFSARVKSWHQIPTDETRIKIQFLNITNDILSEYSFGPYSDTANWVLVEDSFIPPVTTSKVKIRLQSERFKGSNNDGYFDDLFLIPITDEEDNPDTTSTSPTSAPNITNTAYTAAEEPSCRIPLLPDAFSPNGDGNNDRLFAKGKDFKFIKLRIYNKYGELVHRSLEQDAGWDGKFMNLDMNPGVFLYVMEYACDWDGEIYITSGNVTLLR